MKTITITQTRPNVLTFSAIVKGRKIKKDYHLTLLGEAITRFKNFIERKEILNINYKGVELKGNTVTYSRNSITDKPFNNTIIDALNLDIRTRKKWSASKVGDAKTGIFDFDNLKAAKAGLSIIESLKH